MSRLDVGTLAMSQSNGSQDEPDYSQLYVYAGPSLCNIENMTVYASQYQPFLGSDPGLHARIIGSSHYIRTVGGLPYYTELTSCRPIQMAEDFDPVVMNYDITEGINTELHRQAGPFDVNILILTMDLYDDYTAIPDRWDFAYTFEGDGPAAPTAIDYLSDGWETIHTYPEFDVDLYTRTTFTDRSL